MKYEVYSDRIKDVTSILVYSLFIAGLVSILVIMQPQIWAIALIVFLIGLLIWVIYQLVLKVRSHQLLYVLDEAGFTDLSKEGQPLNLTWLEVQKIELILKESVLNISITGLKPLTEEIEALEDRRIVKFQDTNEAYYTIYISGILFRSKLIKEIWTNLKKYSLEHHPNVIIKEHEDGMTKNK